MVSTNIEEAQTRIERVRFVAGLMLEVQSTTALASPSLNSSLANTFGVNNPSRRLVTPGNSAGGNKSIGRIVRSRIYD